jgi:hypothetical protein
MESEGLLPCSQQPATGTYSEPDATNTNLPTQFHPTIHSNVIVPSMPRSSEWSFTFRITNHLSHGLGEIIHSKYKVIYTTTVPSISQIAASLYQDHTTGLSSPVEEEVLVQLKGKVVLVLN